MNNQPTNDVLLDIEEHLEKKRGYKEVLVEDKYSHYRQSIPKRPGGAISNVPVIDVRDGLAERMLAESMRKASNRSKYMNYNQYNLSPKKRNHDTSL